MSTQNECIHQKSAKPIIAGVFNIIVGAACLLGALGLGIAGLVAAPFISFIPFAMPAFFGLLALPLVIVGALAITGGILAVQRRQWGWSLAGSIAATCVSHVLGIVSIVLIVISKREFDL
jgi:hypothetical protein